MVEEVMYMKTLDNIGEVNLPLQSGIISKEIIKNDLCTFEKWETAYANK